MKLSGAVVMSIDQVKLGSAQVQKWGKTYHLPSYTDQLIDERWEKQNCSYYSDLVCIHLLSGKPWLRAPLGQYVSNTCSVTHIVFVQKNLSVLMKRINTTAPSNVWL